VQSEWDLWLDTFVQLQHAAIAVKKDHEAVLAISHAAHELNRCKAGYHQPGGKKFYPFGFEMLA